MPCRAARCAGAVRHARVVYYDTDMAFLKSPAPCLAKCAPTAALCAVEDANLASLGRKKGYFNSGYMVLRPSAAVFASLMALAERFQADEFPDQRLGEQDLLNMHFKPAAEDAPTVQYAPRACNTIGATAADLGTAHVLHAKPPQLYWLGLRPVHGRGQGDQRPMHYATSSHGSEVATLDDWCSCRGRPCRCLEAACAACIRAEQSTTRAPAPAAVPSADECARLKDRSALRCRHAIGGSGRALREVQLTCRRHSMQLLCPRSCSGCDNAPPLP